MNAIANLVENILSLLILAFVARAILSWVFVAGVRNEILLQINYGLSVITEPIIAPIRRIVPRLGGMDLSFIAAILLLIFIRDVVVGTLR